MRWGLSAGAGKRVRLYAIATAGFVGVASQCATGLRSEGEMRPSWLWGSSPEASTRAVA